LTWESIRSCGTGLRVSAYLSRMNNKRSFANNPRVVKEENPNRARMKKKTPTPTISEWSPTQNKPTILTETVLETTNSVWDIVIEQSTNY
jgi:hypothetical protein